MKKKIFFFLFSFQLFLSQKKVSILQEDLGKVESKTISVVYNPKVAAWRSAIIPGWGQYYNKKYWKIPIVWGAIGTGIGFIIWNQKQYTRYNRAFLAELKGQKHEFSDIRGVDLKSALGNAQDVRKRQRDYAIAIAMGIYILNIVDAIVDAHLYEGKRDTDLAISPAVISDFQSNTSFSKLGITLSYKF